ncbi:MAG: cytochrome c oxidase accessory protein CcoG [Kistimonas sp.]|nr:cytochrome c oxidase accessory protein CcoG [Kistimonas sp.]
MRLSKDSQDSRRIRLKNLDESKPGHKIYTRAFSGLFRNLRLCGGLVLFVSYFGTLWLNIDGHQAVLWDLAARQFYIFGSIFLPQDFPVLSGILLACTFGLFLITVLVGRVWCGYACPQSVFTWVFLRLEHWTEGDRNKRMRRDRGRINLDTAVRKLVKYLLWLFVSLAVAVTFVGYFVPVRRLVPDLIGLQVSGQVAFWIIAFTLATYANAGWLREKVCIYMCPYARFQGVMFDKHTWTIHYNAARGEPRGSRKRVHTDHKEALGDCIDCELCVQVCPTGIDIREGLQHECIGCGACVDACNSVMDKMGYDRQLVSYTTESRLKGERSRLLRPRVLSYLLAFSVVVVALGWYLYQRPLLELDVLRDRQSLYVRNAQGELENVYLLRLINKSSRPRSITVSVTGIAGVRIEGQHQIQVGAGGVASMPVRLVVDPQELSGGRTAVVFHAHADDAGSDGLRPLSASTENRFLSPERPL